MRRLPWLSLWILAASLRAQPDLATHAPKVLLDNEFVRVIEFRYSPSAFEPEHHHTRGVAVALSDFEIEAKIFPGGRVGRSQVKFGTVFQVEPETHEVRNLGTTEHWMIFVEPKSSAPGRAAPPGPDALDLVPLGANSQGLRVDNPSVRVTEERANAGHNSEMHRHQRGVRISLSDSDVHVTTLPSHTATDEHVRKGEVRWYETIARQEWNNGSTPAYDVWVELK